MRRGAKASIVVYLSPNLILKYNFKLAAHITKKKKVIVFYYTHTNWVNLFKLHQSIFCISRERQHEQSNQIKANVTSPFSTVLVATTSSAVMWHELPVHSAAEHG